MYTALLILNHFLQLFLLPAAWALLLCSCTQWLFRRHARQCKLSWRQRCLRSMVVACAATPVILLLTAGQSSLLYYAALALALCASEVYHLRLWKA